MLAVSELHRAMSWIAPEKGWPTGPEPAPAGAPHTTSAGQSVRFRLLFAPLALLACFGHADASTCLPSAAAVRQENPNAWPSWTLRAPGHEGTRCWYASTRAKAHDQYLVNHPELKTGVAERSGSQSATDGYDSAHTAPTPIDAVLQGPALPGSFDDRFNAVSPGRSNSEWTDIQRVLELFTRGAIAESW
jgi:hypothetical protein